MRLRQYGRRALQRKAVHLRVARKQTNTQMKGPGKGLLKQNLRVLWKVNWMVFPWGKHVKGRFVKVDTGRLMHEGTFY